MPRWTASITVYNSLDRKLTLEDWRVPWGKVESCPNDGIAPGQSGKFCVYSPAGVSSGLEFYITLRDIAPADKVSYGTVNIKVDIPLGKHANHSSFDSSGLLELSGYQNVKDGAHDYTTSVTVSKLR